MSQETVSPHAQKLKPKTGTAKWNTVGGEFVNYKFAFPVVT